MRSKYSLYEEVELLKTGQRAYIVWVDEDGMDSYLLEIIGSDESPHFYKQEDFKKVVH